MEFSYLMLTGSLSGLMSVLAHSVVRAGLELIRGSPTVSVGATIPEALMHMVSGVGLGLLFWLSWGLAAVVDVAWWVRGLSFAGLCFSALTFPVLASLALRGRMPARAATIIASRWATTCLIAGLACAWSWEHSF